MLDRPLSNLPANSRPRPRHAPSSPPERMTTPNKALLAASPSRPEQECSNSWAALTDWTTRPADGSCSLLLGRQSDHVMPRELATPRVAKRPPPRSDPFRRRGGTHIAAPRLYPVLWRGAGAPLARSASSRSSANALTVARLQWGRPRRRRRRCREGREPALRARYWLGGIQSWAAAVANRMVLNGAQEEADLLLGRR
jgi:hypothetical protein